MNKIYKGYELMKAVDEGELTLNQKVNSINLDYKNCTIGFVLRDMAINIMLLQFELIEDEEKIDIQSIEEINLDFHKGYADICKYLKEKGNEIIKALKQIDKNQKRCKQC